MDARNIIVIYVRAIIIQPMRNIRIPRRLCRNSAARLVLVHIRISANEFPKRGEEYDDAQITLTNIRTYVYLVCT